MKFAHLADCHLGSWRQPELQKLNLESFKTAIDISLKEKVDFVLIAGDLFDSAYPPIEILEETFSELKKLKDKDISCYIIAGSHDYSVSGKTFLSILEKAGFCRNLYNPEEKNGVVFLAPIIHGNIALYGYPGKKSGLEVQEIKNIKLHEAPGLFRIFALHTCIREASKNLPIESVNESELPEADYYALGHLHIDFNKNNFIYPGPTFPNNFQELEELKNGRFYIVETEPFQAIKKQIKIKETEFFEIEIQDALVATEKIIEELRGKNLSDKIVLLKLRGKLKKGKTSNIKFEEIENFVKEKNAYTMLKSTSKLIAQENEINVEIDDMDKLEDEIIKKYLSENKSKFNPLIHQLINSLSIEKQESETSSTFNSRLFSELNKVLKIDLK
ncbi:MAG: DNA repair exonuclease [Nanoarchaeota archaeon]|nr:DNA repair exonuclease [Nanoarchaeota archaeon]